MPFENILFIVGAFSLGLLAGLFVLRRGAADSRELLQKAEVLLEESKKESERLVKSAKENMASRRKQFITEQEEFASQLEKMDQMIALKTASHQKREAKIQDVRKAIEAEEKSVHGMKYEISKSDDAMKQELIKISGSSAERAKEEIVVHYENDYRADEEGRFQRVVEWAQECAVRDSKNVLAEAICRFSDITLMDQGEGKVLVARDEMKGRIVGRGGLTVAYLEELLGVDIIFNDEPNTILVGCFNLVQREIARLALERLLREKNITEEVAQRVKKQAEQDMDKILRREGEAALKLFGLNKGLPDEFIKLVGRLKFRTSYGQNVLRHCLEVGFLARLIAGQIGADENIALQGGFFHDIGKAIDQEVGGSHDALSKEILEKYGFSWEITHAAWTHHNAIPQETVEARIVQAADAISAGRPGARAESLERYLAKIKELEETALSFNGTKKVFTINAGREVRVLVEPEKVNDAGAQQLAEQIAAKVQEKGGYPGRIKITTVRVTKTTDYAR